MPICERCGTHHDVSDMEPSLRRPDAFLEVPPGQREVRTLESKDLCAVRDANRENPRYFVRVLAPFGVEGRDAPCCWGIWAEVSESAFDRIRELWDDPAQSDAPPLDGLLANRVHGYTESTLGLPGWVQLVGPDTIPVFHFRSAVGHPFAKEQRRGVSEAKVLAWLEPFLHRQGTS